MAQEEAHRTIASLNSNILGLQHRLTQSAPPSNPHTSSLVIPAPSGGHKLGWHALTGNFVSVIVASSVSERHVKHTYQLRWLPHCRLPPLNMLSPCTAKRQCELFARLSCVTAVRCLLD